MNDPRITKHRKENAHTYILMNEVERWLSFPRGSSFRYDREDCIHLYPNGGVSLLRDVKDGYARSAVDLQNLKFNAGSTNERGVVVYVNDHEFMSAVYALSEDPINAEAATKLIKEVGDAKNIARSHSISS